MKKAVFFNMMIDIEEKDLDISIRKKPWSNPSIGSSKRKK